MWLLQGSIFLFTVQTEGKGRAKKWFCQVQCGDPNEFSGVAYRSMGQGLLARTQQHQVRTSQPILSQRGQQLRKPHRWSTPCKLRAATPLKAPLVHASSQPWFIAYVTWLGGVKFCDYQPLIRLKHSHCCEFSSATKDSSVALWVWISEVGQGPGSILENCFHGNTQMAQTVTLGAVCSSVLAPVVATRESYSNKVS